MSEGGTPDLSGAVEAVEAFLLGDTPSLTRVEVAEQAGVSIEVAKELWRLMGFPQQTDEAVAFTPADIRALETARELIDLGVLSPERQAALVRTWGRSYARLAEWQTTLLTDVALESDADPVETLTTLSEQVLPRVDALQSYVWRRHLASAGSRQLTVDSAGSHATDLAVCFVDIVGYTTHSKNLGERELVRWIEYFESECAGIVVDHGARIIKNIGDEVLLVAEDVTAAAEVALTMTDRGSDVDDRFPAVRAGVAYGGVVSRLGDVFGPTVNIAARLTSVARPGSVLCEQGTYELLSGRSHDEGDDAPDSEGGDSAYTFRRLRRVSVKGYSRLHCWSLRRA